MQIQRMNLSSTQLVSLEKLKTYMKIDGNEEDELISDLQFAAYNWIEQFTGRSILTTEWKFTTTPLKTGYEVRHALPFPSLLEITKVNHLYSNIKSDETKTYFIDFRHGIKYICVISKGVPIEVVYSAGFGPTAKFVPEAFHQAIKILVAFWYEDREGLGCGIPATVEKILRPYQIRRII